MKKLLFIILTLFIQLVISLNLFSQSNTNIIYFSAGTGFQLPIGDFTKEHYGAAKLGYVLNGKISFSLNRKFLIYTFFSTRYFNTDLKTENLDTYWYIIDYDVGVKMKLSNSHNHPFLCFGFGLYKPTANTKGNSISIKVRGNNNFGFHTGVGIELKITPVICFEPSIMFHHFTDNKFGENNFDFFSVNGSIVIYIKSF